MIDLDKVVATGLSFLGVPWVHAGRNPATGLDCQGVIVQAYYPAGWQPNDRAAVDDVSYGRRPDVEKMKRVLRGEGQEVAIFALQPADVILFRPWHLALVTGVIEGKVYFIHSNQKVGKVTQTHIDESWKRRFIAAYRFAGGDA